MGVVRPSGAVQPSGGGRGSAMTTWAPVAEGSEFPIENLPFGVFRLRDDEPRVGVRIGDHVVDLVAAGLELDLTARSSLNPLIASGRGGVLRDRVAELLDGEERPDLLHPIDDVHVLMPVEVVDYIDFYSSIHHATNLGRILRPDSEPLLPNWRHLPVAYHGRSRTVVVSGTPVTRPEGLVPDPVDGVPRLTPTRALDIELEVGFLVGGPPTACVPPDHADRHIFGVVLLNDWSARDIQGYEYQPLGPHLAKSFATTISPWVVTLDALRPYLVEPPEQDPEPDPYLRAALPWGLDLNLTVELNGHVISGTNFSHMYWTFAQQLAHMTVNGAPAGAGDIFGSGTVSGPTKAERGSLVELTWRGAEPLELPDGTTRTFLEDGDTVTLRGWCGGQGGPRIGFGEATGTIVPTPSREGDG
jgi:fumarylacetoacetase